MRAAVIGAGSFGTALAAVLAGKGHEVRLWSKDEEQVRLLRDTRENRAYIPGYRFPPNVTFTTSLREALAEAELVVSAIPSQGVREVFGGIVELLPVGVPIVTASKGIEEGTLKLPTEVLEDVLPEKFHPYIVVLSGPSFAKEMVAGVPTAVTVAASWERSAAKVQDAFNSRTFRCYTSTDPVGVQLGAALKNVVAIAAGIVDGLGFGHNTRAALITRGLAEIVRMAVHRGANPVTLSGLSGVGDLVLTCTGELSRNRTVGVELGRGKKLPEILAALGQVAEGVKTARSARDLAQKLGVDAPITEQIYLILHEGKDAKQAVVELLSRDPKPEFRT